MGGGYSPSPGVIYPTLAWLEDMGYAEIAEVMGLSTKAVKSLLSRARANLRLEFLLAFRRTELPTARCRPVLLALAVGDGRRQAQLDAQAHVRDCPTCAALVGRHAADEGLATLRSAWARDAPVTSASSNPTTSRA